MAAESGYLQLLGAFWQWVQKDIGLWLRAMGSVRDVLAERDLESDYSLSDALRLSAFSILIAIIMDISAEAIFTNASFSIPYGIFLVVAYYLFTVVIALSFRIMSFLLVSKQSMRTCLVMALFMCVYWPLNNVSDFLILGDKYLTLMSSAPSLSVYYIVMHEDLFNLTITIAWTVILYMYIAAKLFSAIRYVFHVGRFRAIVAVVGSGCIFSLALAIPMRPLMQAWYKHWFGA